MLKTLILADLSLSDFFENSRTDIGLKKAVSVQNCLTLFIVAESFITPDLICPSQKHWESIWLKAFQHQSVFYTSILFSNSGFHFQLINQGQFSLSKNDLMIVATVTYLSIAHLFAWLQPELKLWHYIKSGGWLTLILSMQSVVLDARMHESLAKAATAAGGSTATRALARSAHFLCSGSDTVHHRIFLADMSGSDQRKVNQKMNIHFVQNVICQLNAYFSKVQKIKKNFAFC